MRVRVSPCISTTPLPLKKVGCGASAGRAMGTGTMEGRSSTGPSSAGGVLPCSGMTTGGASTAPMTPLVWVMRMF